ncbi:hypothetical protein [Rubrobacter calidifluminis]|uniref:hypothetical protein n=1 Tax=Rubrobacter calidifluminis TaxID=1392640 RepID=UPI00235FCC7D|nr:hypothetical protein [Rubrobacter calidifluminis]
MSAVYFAEEQWAWRNRLLRVALASGAAFHVLWWRAGGRKRVLVEGLSCTAVTSLLAAARLSVRVGPEGLEIRFRPLLRRRIPIREITSWQVVRYRPLADYGGWGIRWCPGGRAYTVSGDRGVRITLEDGREVLVGSHRPDELADAIARAKGVVF